MDSGSLLPGAYHEAGPTPLAQWRPAALKAGWIRRMGTHIGDGNRKIRRAIECRHLVDKEIMERLREYPERKKAAMEIQRAPWPAGFMGWIRGKRMSTAWI